jgi:hypothetical protein
MTKYLVYVCRCFVFDIVNSEDVTLVYFEVQRANGKFRCWQELTLGLDGVV